MNIEDAARKFYWLTYNKKTNEVDMYLDNFTLSSFRLCESHGFLEHIALVNPRYDNGSRKPWYFEFGEFVHYCTQWFFINFKKEGKPPIVDDWLAKCKEKWEEMKMDEYDSDKVYKADRDRYSEIGGWQGAAGLLIEYYAFYMDLRVRIVDVEISFGYNKEVPLGNFTIQLPVKQFIYKRKRKYTLEILQNIKVNCYLTGRIDLLVDNGYKVGPVDHKTTAKFDGYEHEDFNPQDGITGYILTIKNILERYREAKLTNLPTCTGGWIYHISNNRPSIPRDKSKPTPARFKTTPIDKTDISLEDYKSRQITTFRRIINLLLYDETPQWNTANCNNMFYRKCKYKTIHEQPSNEWIQIIANHYSVGKVWDTRDHDRNNNNSGNNSESGNKLVRMEEQQNVRTGLVEAVTKS